MRQKYLQLYYEWSDKGWMPSSGLCGSLYNHDLLQLFIPEKGWGWFSLYDGGIYKNSVDLDKVESLKLQKEFTPLRQNVVLFMAAMNGEL